MRRSELCVRETSLSDDLLRLHSLSFTKLRLVATLKNVERNSGKSVENTSIQINVEKDIVLMLKVTNQD